MASFPSGFGARGRWECSPGRLAHRGDTEWEPAAEVVFRGQARSPSHRQIRGTCRVRCDDGRLFGRDIRWSRPSRKASARGALPPVPQTDTGGQVENTKAIERILVKELGNHSRAFGIRETPDGDGTRFRSFRGWHRPGGSDCLPKTQVHAKAQAAVYALTPARCRKVKRIRQPSGEAVNSSPGKRRW